jgi:hypothetical protein
MSIQTGGETNMWKLAMALGLGSLIGCQGTSATTVPPVERFAAHQGPLWPAGTHGQTYYRETSTGFIAYGIATDGIKFAVSGTPAELSAFGAAVQQETGIDMERCRPSPPTGDIIGPIPCPPGPSGKGGDTGGGETLQ